MVPNSAGAGEIRDFSADSFRTSPNNAEIIVTANRRPQRIQDTSLAISVIDGRQLADAGITQATELSAIVPSLNVSLGGAYVQTYLRGVGSFSTDATAESAVAYSINSVYVSRPNGLGAIFFDLERVEVIKGPQGTLYGRNATGGTINLVTRRPTHNFTAEAQGEFGNYGLKRFTGALGGGLGEALAMRAAIQRVDRRGYLSDGYKDQKSTSARLTALWEPDTGVTALVTAEYVDQGGMGDAPVMRAIFTPVPDNRWEGPSIGNTQQPPTASVPGGARISDDGYLDLRVWALSAEIGIDLGFANLTFIPAYRDVKVDALNYVPGFPFDRHETARQQSYELRLGNGRGRLDWVAGLFYFAEDQTQIYELRSPPIQQLTVDTPLATRSYAAFGDARFAVIANLRLIGGLRYSHERKRQGGMTVAVLPAAGLTDNSGERSFANLSWRAGAEYDLTSMHMLFATAATGHKSGGFFPSIAAPDNSFRPEKLTAFTIGSRSRFLDGRLQLNAEAFYWKYRDKQERFIGATPAAGAGLLTTNAGRATLYGANVDMVFKPTPRDSLRASVEYLHTNYDRFAYQAFNRSVGPFINSYPTEATGCLLGPAVAFTANDANPALRGDSLQRIDCSGKPLVRAPKWSGTLSYEHVFDLAGRPLAAKIDGQFASSQYISADFIQSARDNGFFLLNAQLTFRPSKPLRLTAWARNITRQAVYTGGIRYTFSRPRAAGGDPTLFYAHIGAPRIIGGTLAFEF